MSVKPKIYQIEDAGGSGKCFFYSVHDSILSREQESTPKKEILTDIYRCFNISKAQYDAKADIFEKRNQFNEDIRKYLAAQIRKDPSELKKMDEADFKKLYADADNKTLFEQTKRLGEQDINNYPGVYESLINPLTYRYMTENDELFELQAAGASNLNAIQAMGKDKFYKLIADVLEKNNYTTYALQPMISLLNYCLTKCNPQGYCITILYPGMNIQLEAQIQTKYEYGKDCLVIPVYKTQGAHYQAIVEQKQLPILTSESTEVKKRSQSQISQDFLADVNKILNEAKKVDKKLEDELNKIIKKEKFNKTDPDKQRIIQLKSGEKMFIIPRTFFKLNKVYQSIEEAGNTPLVGPFLVKAIRIRSKDDYYVDVIMKDGTQTRIYINTKEGHFVSYKLSNDDIEKSNRSNTNVKKTIQLIKPDSYDKFTSKLKGILGDYSEEYLMKKDDSKKENIGTEPLSMEEFKRKIEWEKFKAKAEFSKKGGFRKINNYKKTLKNRLKRKSVTRRKFLGRRK